ncbi:MAG: hypothetical protein KGL35_10300 [Bradyrhizobium sp.]|uniref:hypothetical protein n=1 Tax=Bradyrhizobium sp. TaxID=376 RepID=UPI00239F1647|nr:hypothetical protein [Bradyrhizobium sp.]MDE2469108.1 hypothetical protein [Bradyrhizobium sp.]
MAKIDPDSRSVEQLAGLRDQAIEKLTKGSLCGRRLRSPRQRRTMKEERRTRGVDRRGGTKIIRNRRISLICF